jgi:hypothetical protein
MHAVLITFRSEAALDDVHDDFLAGAHAIAEVPGLLSKTWIANDERWGGFYLFTDADAATTYLDGPIIAATKAVPAFSDWDVQQFTVIEEFSALTRGIPTTTPAAAD